MVDARSFPLRPAADKPSSGRSAACDAESVRRLLAARGAAGLSAATTRKDLAIVAPFTAWAYERRLLGFALSLDPLADRLERCAAPLRGA